YKPHNVITLFHKAGSPASLRMYTLLKQASAIASEHATEDQASDHSHQTLPGREEFELNITEDPPTAEQLKSILEYIGTQTPSTIVKGAKDKVDAMKKLKGNAENFQRPVTVDWKNGKAVAGDDISKILKMVEKKTHMAD
ncbi:thioredoxin-like protein, partial [Leptodontidium sp. MPI-SDFR-AT-0119]